MAKVRLLVLVLAALWLWPACAPLSTSSAVREAEAQVFKAKKEGAAKYAKYEYYSAVYYLRKAKLTEGYSEFGVAQQYSTRAKEMAMKAQTEAKENRLREQILKKRLKQRDKFRRAK